MAPTFLIWHFPLRPRLVSIQQPHLIGFPGKVSPTEFTLEVALGAVMLQVGRQITAAQFGPTAIGTWDYIVAACAEVALRKTGEEKHCLGEDTGDLGEVLQDTMSIQSPHPAEAHDHGHRTSPPTLPSPGPLLSSLPPSQRCSHLFETLPSKCQVLYKRTRHLTPHL